MEGGKGEEQLDGARVERKLGEKCVDKPTE